MGGMGFGKRSPDYYDPGEVEDYEYEQDEEAAINYLQQLQDYQKIIQMEREEEEGDQDTEIEEEKRSISSMRGFNSKRGLASMARMASAANDPQEKRGLSSVRAGKRGFGSALAAMEGRGKRRGNLSSLRSQGYTSYKRGL